MNSMIEAKPTKCSKLDAPQIIDLLDEQGFYGIVGKRCHDNLWRFWGIDRETHIKVSVKEGQTKKQALDEIYSRRLEIHGVD